MPSEPFGAYVRDKLAFLVSEHGFGVIQEDEHVVLLESPILRVEAVWDPRGEVAVNVYRWDKREAGMWSYSGFVRRATVPRLLEIAADRMRDQEQVLSGDTAYYDELASEQQSTAEQWTAYYSRKGPRPDTRRLP